MADNVKIVTFVPESHADAVRKAMGAAGAGVIGNYGHCSFSSKGTGRFAPLAGARPTFGEVGKQSEIDEERIEVVCAKDRVKEVIAAIKKAHPYEEAAVDVYPLISENEL